MAENGQVVSRYTLPEVLARSARLYGGRPALLAENMPQWGIAYFAVTCMGAVVVPIMTEFPPAQIANIKA